MKKRSLYDILIGIGFGFILIWIIAFLINVFKLKLYEYTFWYIGVILSTISMIIYSLYRNDNNIINASLLIGIMLFSMSIIVMMVKFAVKKPAWLIYLGIGILIDNVVNAYYIFKNNK